MEYTVQQLATLSGVTPRTLRYYDRFGLLKPARISGGGYRMYSREQVDRLQQILFFRELGVSLEHILEMLSNPSFDGTTALKNHRDQLMQKRAQIDRLIRNVEQTILSAEGKKDMSDDEKFIGFKQEMINKNEKQYGEEVRSRYGNETVERSNQKVMGMSKQEHDRVAAMAEEIHVLLSQAMDAGDPAGPLAQKAAALHGEWLCAYWPAYDPEAHANLARMYVEDERFRAYYDARRTGAAVFLRDAVLIHTGR